MVGLFSVIFLLLKPPFLIILKEHTDLFRATIKYPTLTAHDSQKRYRTYKLMVEKRLASFLDTREPISVYDPIRYVLSSGGKKVRAVLVLLACEAVGGKAKEALDAAAAIEVLHNFTLVHDDVMDHADMRRGRATVHKKWDTNVAILAGDELVAQAYRLLSSSNSSSNVLGVFTDAFVQVCEGQGLDKEFESRRNVRLNDYLEMIGKKTARMISAASEIGALIGGGTASQVTALRTFGKELGLAFQIQDDLLDITGDEKEFGKAIGGDIVEGKKTYLLLTALERVRGGDRTALRSLTPRNGMTRKQIHHIRDIYIRAGVVQSAQKEIAQRTHKAKAALRPIPSSVSKSMLLWLADQLLDRQN